jgi:hypothetical protein
MKMEAEYISESSVNVCVTPQKTGHLKIYLHGRNGNSKAVPVLN